MRIFECERCGQQLYFENVVCVSCGAALGFREETQALVALEPAGEDAWRVIGDGSGQLYRFCGNKAHEACNWLIPARENASLCRACRHNRVIPDLSLARNLVLWRNMEGAKKRLFYSLLRFDLPLALRPEDPAGLTFDFPSDEAGDQDGPVMTGHANGLITINLAEADDAEREKSRTSLRETYRTLLGHLRHETGHYYWDRLVRDDPETLAWFRALFGDERADYAEALKRHYEQGPSLDWAACCISPYASSHPWEDFAETWAHYLHIVDTLETARAFGVRVRAPGEGDPRRFAAIEFDPYDHAPIARLIEAWLPLTFAVNSLNRAMGQRDLYPFVLTPPAIEKLGFVAGLIAGAKP